MADSTVIEVYSIGTELVMGRIQDTNAHWIAAQIAQLGGALRRMTIVPDEIDDVIAAVGGGIDRGTDIIVSELSENGVPRLFHCDHQAVGVVGTQFVICPTDIVSVSLNMWTT